MQRLSVPAVAAVLCHSVVASKSHGDHPVAGVIKLLQGLEEKTKAEGQQEEVTFSKFSHWCKNSAKTLDVAIADEKAQIDSLTDQISAKTRQSKTLNKQIEELNEEIQKNDESQSGADGQRSKAAALYDAADKDYGTTAQAIKDAIAALKDAGTSTSSLAQQRVANVLALAAAGVTESDRKALNAFVQRPDVKATGDDAAHVKKYNFKSGNVIDLLKNLLMSFEDQKLAGTKAETNSLNAHQLTSDARANAKDSMQKSKDVKTESLATTDSDLVAAKQSMQETQDDLSADSTSLADTKKQCSLKQSEWAERSGIREGELKAIGMAVKILSKVTGVRTEAPENPIPPASPVALVQMLDALDPRTRAVQLLREEAKETHSKALERIAQEISVHRAGPFQDVNNMIQKMIFRLMDEQKR